ncbi:MAG: Na-K-Cl cotransporter [Candidatus Eisenbacteria bacterium]
MEKKLGTFLGVYTPTILTILGVILYLRLGWLTGHLGLQRIVLAVLLANGITLITALSFSAVATNTQVGVGGAYYIISRSLGIEIGGAIGLPLFLCQALSTTLYAFGLAESLRFAWAGVPLQAATVVILIAVGVLSATGARYALRTQVPLMALVGLSLFALTVGLLSRQGGGPLSLPAPSGEIRFWQGFAIFFPAVTGVMAGLGLSGDLKNPGRSIPLGSILAVLTGFGVYLFIPFLLATGVNAADLREDSLVWTRVALLGPWLVLPGLWAAIFSSAVGSALGAPRTLQALARDGLAPGFFGRMNNERQDILPGLGVTLAIGLAAVFLGDLNTVASIVTMFFLTVYGTANLVAAFEALSGDPSWRPKIRIPWPVSLAGGIACIVTMFLISPVAGAIAVVAELSLWLFLSRRERAARWGDARRGLYENLIRWALIHLARRPVSARNWRPHILVFASEAIHELDLIRFGNWFSQGRGVVTVCQLVVGDLLREDLDLKSRAGEMQAVFDTENLVVFAEVDVVRNLVDGIVDVAQANGMAGIASNTVMLGWPSEKELQVQFLRVMRRLEALNKSLVIGRIMPKHLFPMEGVKRTIHVWWGGLHRNGDLMLLLAYLLTRNPSWRGAKVQVLSLATSEVMKAQIEEHLGRLIPQIRIDAEPMVLMKPKDVSVSDLIQEQSAKAEVVFLGLATPEHGEEEAYADRLEKLAGEMPAVFFVKNASLFIGELLGEPESIAEKRGLPAAPEAPRPAEDSPARK